jgi:hypothetical protein
MTMIKRTMTEVVTETIEDTVVTTRRKYWKDGRDICQTMKISTPNPTAMKLVVVISIPGSVDLPKSR